MIVITPKQRHDHRHKQFNHDGQLLRPHPLGRGFRGECRGRHGLIGHTIAVLPTIFRADAAISRHSRRGHPDRPRVRHPSRPAQGRPDQDKPGDTPHGRQGSGVLLLVGAGLQPRRGDGLHGYRDRADACRHRRGADLHRPELVHLSVRTSGKGKGGRRQGHRGRGASKDRGEHRGGCQH